MTTKEKTILENVGKALPSLSDREKEHFLYMTEGLCLKARLSFGEHAHVEVQDPKPRPLSGGAGT